MFLSAWAVDGSKVPASMARRETYRANNGNGGITNAEDLEVVALPTPGAAVRIMPGSATILNTYAGGDGQAYGVANDAAFDLAVPATGSGSGATRYVIVRIDDPEFGGQNPAEPLTAPYNYPTLVSSVESLTYPFEVLARINQPASTATITKGLITDMREIANPRSDRVRRVYELPGDGSGNKYLSSPTGGPWPGSANFQIEVPPWATEAIITCDWLSVYFGTGGNATGAVYVEYGPNVAGGKQKYSTNGTKYDSPGAAAGYTRQTLSNADASRPVPADIRGSTVPFVPKGKVYTAGANPTMDEMTAVVLDVEFFETPVGASA